MPTSKLALAPDADGRLKKQAGDLPRRACRLNRIYLFVLAGAFVAGGVLLLLSLLQPVNTALKTRANSTAMDSFFIGTGKIYWFGGKHK